MKKKKRYVNGRKPQKLRMQQINDISIVTLQRTDQIVVYMGEEPNMTPINPQNNDQDGHEEPLSPKLFMLRRCHLHRFRKHKLLTWTVWEGLCGGYAHPCTLMQGTRVKSPLSEAGVGRVLENRRQLTTRKRSVSVFVATSVDGIDRYQAKDTIWKISVR